MGNPGKQENTKSFWASLPGVLTAVAGLVTAVAGFIAVWPDRTPEIDAGSKSKCQVEEPSWAKEMPDYLRYTIEGNYSAPLYWFEFDVTNKTDRTVNVGIEFVVKGINADVDPDEAKYSIGPSERIVRRPNPRIEYLSDTAKPKLELSWEVRDRDLAYVLRSGEAVIKVLDDRTIYWDLETPRGDTMPVEFLVASLSAWALTSDAWVTKYADLLAKDLDTDYMSQWVEKVYSYVFDTFGVKVSPPIVLPMEGEQLINLPDTIIGKQQAHPLELGLMFCNLALKGLSNYRPEFALICVTKPPPETDCKALFCWSDDSGWHAIDLVSANDTTTDYDSNRDLATSYLKPLLQANRWIVSNLDSTGVAIAEDRSFFALDVRKAADWFGIENLP